MAQNAHQTLISVRDLTLSTCQLEACHCSNYIFMIGPLTAHADVTTTNLLYVVSYDQIRKKGLLYEMLISIQII